MRVCYNDNNNNNGKGSKAIEDNVVTLKMMQENVPSYEIILNDDFLWEATTTLAGGPTWRGSKEWVIRCIAAEQGWSMDQIEATVDDSRSSNRGGW